MDIDKENRPRRKAWVGKASEGKLSDRPVSRGNIPDECVEAAVENRTLTEVSQLTSLPFVDNEVADFQNFCEGWEKQFTLSTIGQGSYASVFKMELKCDPGQYSVWKMMPLKPSKGRGSRPPRDQTLIKDAATEVQMLVAMSDIDGFVQFRSAHVVKGSVPDQIGGAHKVWAKTLTPKNTWYRKLMKIEFPSKDQLWLLMEMTDAGQDLESLLCTARLENKDYSVHETSDMFWGIAEALVRGEEQAEFEHRDMHAGNICIKIRDKPLNITTEHGVPRLSKYEVTLIDYTLSRLTTPSGDVLATAIDEAIFRQTGDTIDAKRQNAVYRTMRSVVKNKKKPGVTKSQMWNEYVPRTNVLWLRHVLRDLFEVTQNRPNSQEEKKMRKALLDLGNQLWRDPYKYRSARKVINGFLLEHK